MCSVCGMTPCLAGCPNEPLPKVVHQCSFCGEDIVEGELMVELDGEAFHEDCFSDAATKLLFERFGAMSCIAEADDYGY